MKRIINVKGFDTDDIGKKIQEFLVEDALILHNVSIEVIELEDD